MKEQALIHAKSVRLVLNVITMVKWSHMPRMTGKSRVRCTAVGIETSQEF